MKEKFYRWQAKRKLIKRYEYLSEVDKLMEEYETFKILGGGSDRYIQDGRKNLIETQMRLREQQKLIAFLKSL